MEAEAEQDISNRGATNQGLVSALFCHWREEPRDARDALGLTVVLSVGPRSMAPLFLPFSIRPKITNSNSFHPLAHRLRPSRPSYEALRRIRAAGPVAMEERAHLVARACKDDDDDHSGSTQAGAAAKRADVPTALRYEELRLTLKN